MLRALICFVLIVLAVPSWGAPDVMSVDRNGTLTHLLPGGFEEATVHEAPANGRVQIDGRSLEYWPNQGFEGLDRVEVEATSNQSYVLQIVVGDPRPSQINVIYERLAALLFVLAIVAIVLEVAFTALFNNRAFRKLNWFPGIKTLVAFGGSAVVVWVFQFDIFGEIMRAISASDAFLPGAGWVSGGITALLLAGGSGTVFYLYTKLGIRNPFGQGLTGAAAQGTGHLKFSVTRARVGDGDPIGVSLGTGATQEFLGQIPVGSSTFGGDLGREISAGVYLLVLHGNNASGAPISFERNVVVEAGTLTSLEDLAF